MHITEQTIQQTRQHFADTALGCIEDALNGLVVVNDLPGYIAQQYRHAAGSLAGDFDHTFTFVQQAIYLQTGECIPFL